MVQSCGPIRVSRYNADRKQVSCHLIVILLKALVQCRVTNGQRSQELVMVQDGNKGTGAESGYNDLLKIC